MAQDEEIIKMFFARTEDAIRELDVKYGKMSHKLSYNILRNKQDAEECVNDAYLGIWNAIPPARPNPLQAFVCKIVRNVSLKAYYKSRAAKRNSVYTVAMEEIEECLPCRDSVESAFDSHELTKLIESFLDALDSDNRTIFLRRYWFCDSCKEIAAITGLTTKNVTVRLSRIRQKLKNFLRNNEVYI